MSSAAALEPLQGHNDSVESICCIGGSVYTASKDGKVFSWENATGKAASKRQELGDTGAVSVVDILPDPPYESLFTAGHNAAAKQWRLTDGQLLMTFDHPAAVVAMCAHDGFFGIPGNRHLAPMRRPALFTACEDAKVRMWAVESVNGKGNRQTCQMAREFGGSSYGVVRALLAMDVAGEWANVPSLFAGGDDMLIRQYHLKGGSCVRIMSGHTAPVRVLCEDTMTRQRLISGSADKTVKVWAIAKGTLLHTLTGHQDTVTDLCMAYGWLFSASLDGTVRMWDIISGQAMSTLCPVGAGAIMSLSSNGTHLFVGLGNGTCPRYCVAQLLKGSRVEVWWGGDAQWYPATVKDFNSSSQKYRLIYDDGDAEEFELPSIEVRLNTGLDPRRGPRGEMESSGAPLVGRSKRGGVATSYVEDYPAVGALQLPPFHHDDEELSTVKSTSVDPELPYGWTVEERKRTNANSKTVKRVDKYYIAPNGKTFRSKLEAKRYLEQGGDTVGVVTTPAHSNKRPADPDYEEGRAKKVQKLSRPGSEAELLPEDTRETSAPPQNPSWMSQSESPAAMTPGMLSGLEGLGSALLGDGTSE